MAHLDSCVDTAISEAMQASVGSPSSARAEYVGLCLIAKAEGAPLPEPPPKADEVDTASLEAIIAAARSNAAGACSVAEVLLRVGEHLCPKAARIPPNAYVTHYELCRAVPYVIQIDAFLSFPGPGYHFSMSRVTEAKRQSWQLVKEICAQGRCDRLLVMSGNPAVGKSTWVEHVGAQEANAASTLFFDDVLNNRRRRGQWWDAFRASGLSVPVDLVVITRDFERALASNVSRGLKGGHSLPRDAMERFWKDFEMPSLEEGFTSIRVFENLYDESTGEGGFALLR